MCGIAGGLALHGSRPLARTDLEAMVAALEHRGPDGFGYFQQGPVGLAHARLSIIDLQTGEQPIANEDETVWVVFNGEIFNYIELRAELQALGHRFRTNSDTETIVHAYEQYGLDFVSHLNGQFAIALWDQPRQKLVLARDRVGIRPLYYTRSAGQMLFASEIKGLRPAMRDGLRLSPAGVAQVFTFWATVTDSSAFEQIYSLPPGCLLTVEGDKETLHRYWDWSFATIDDHAFPDLETAAEQLRQELTQSVRLQLRADVPVGAYLSGGLDSSVIVALIRQVTSVPMRTFSVNFTDAEFDEQPFQQAMVDHLGTEHTSLHCSRLDIGKAFPRLIRHAEVPVLRTAPVPLMLLSGEVRRAGFKVVLTGEGADEVFGGYDLFKEAKVRRFWARNPGSQARAALLTRLYPYLKHSPVRSAAMAISFYKAGLEDVDNPFYAHDPRWATTRRLWNFFGPDFRQQVSEQTQRQALQASLPADFASWPALGRDQYVEAHTLMSGYLLSAQGDRVAMANSVEGRFPFLDHHVIEFANRLPPRFKIRGLTEKAILRRAMRDLLPTNIATRTKQPYRAPDSPSFFSDGKPLDYVEDLMSVERIKSAGYFDPIAVSRLFEKCRSGRAIGFSDNMAFVGILSTMLLDEYYVRCKHPDR